MSLSGFIGMYISPQLTLSKAHLFLSLDMFNRVTRMKMNHVIDETSLSEILNGWKLCTQHISNSN